MKCYSLSHLADDTLLQGLASLVKQDRATTAELLSHLAEVDERRLYRPAAYPSMYLYCVNELRMSEETAYKRIRAARAARQFPAIFPALADGRLNLSGVLLLSPKLTSETANGLLTAAANKTHSEIEQLLAERFPQPDLPTLVGPIAAPVASSRLSVRSVEAAEQFRQLATWPVATIVGAATTPLAPGPVATSGPVDRPVLFTPLATRAKLAPLSPGRFALQLTVDQETQDLLRYAQALLGHVVPSGDVATVLKRSLISLVRELEQQKFAKSARSRPQHGAPNGRHVPAEVRRKVWERDGGQCTFVSDHGKRCAERTRLEFDHMDPVARGGQATAGRMRLRCQAHNQYEAECAFGAGFMRGKREEARCRAAQPEAAPGSASQQDVIPWLRALGFSSEEACRAAARCGQIPDAPLEERVRVALRSLAPNCVRRPAPVASSPA